MIFIILMNTLLLLPIKGTFCQKITFDNTDVGGIKEGRFYIDGTIGENVTALVLQNWQPFLSVMVKRKTDPRFILMCALEVPGATCFARASNCHCFYNTTTANVHFVISGIARPDLYKALIRVQWQHRNTTNVYSNNYTVPGPEDTTNASKTRSTPTSPTAGTSSPSSSSTRSVSLGNTSSTDDRMSAEPRSCTLIFCDLYLALSLLFLELLGGAAYGIIWCIFFKKDKGNDAGLTPDVTVNPETPSLRGLT
ncbi:hypothetical protein BsWGS_16922 [Bradybaena similaris]